MIAQTKDVNVSLEVRRRLGLFGLLLVLSGCGDECRSYSAYTCSELNQARFNVIFSFPDGRERYLGAVSGLPQCGQVAYAYAEEVRVGRDWSYVCCLATKNSDCAEKHR